MALFPRGVERGVAFDLPDVYIGAVLQQQLYRRGIPFVDGTVQRRVTINTPRIRTRPGGQQPLERSGTTPYRGAI